MQTASILLLWRSSKNSISDWRLAVWDINLKFFVVPLGTQRWYQTILQPDWGHFQKWCHPSIYHKMACFFTANLQWMPQVWLICQSKSGAFLDFQKKPKINSEEAALAKIFFCSALTVLNRLSPPLFSAMMKDMWGSLCFGKSQQKC